MGRVRNFGNKSQGALYFGGAEPTADDDCVEIGNSLFRFVVDEGDEGDGEIPVVLAGSVAGTVTALIAAIQANKPTPGIGAYADPVSNKGVRLIADQPGEEGNVDLSVTMTDVLNVASGATLVGGKNPGNRTLHAGEYTVTALDESMASVVIETGLDAPVNVQVTVRDVDGVFKEDITNKMAVSGSKITYDGTGATDLAEDDVVCWSAWE